ncbi:MAG: hypothetical protein L6435_05660 [Anaerolineae bacterium]|nr:hypothetical protein [Anaerolineae bacterium]
MIKEVVDRISDNIQKVIVGKREVIELTMVALLSQETSRKCRPSPRPTYERTTERFLSVKRNWIESGKPGNE